MLQMIRAIISFQHEGLITEDVKDFVTWMMPSFLVCMVGGMVGYYLLQKRKINYHHIVHGHLFVIGCVFY
jgi:Na+/glutamate symporter